MFSYQPQIYENNQWQALSPWARPFTDGTALNDVLDAGCINLSLSSRYNPIKPFTPIRIIISENGVEVDRIYRLVSSTKRTRRTFAPSVGAKYDWTINTIELTKAMERRFIGTLTSTRYLSADYASGKMPAPVIKSGKAFDNGYLIEKNKIFMPLKVGTSFAIPYFNWGKYQTVENSNGLYATSNSLLNFVNNTMSVISPSGVEIVKVLYYNGTTSTTKTIELTETGTYHIKYEGYIEQETTHYDFSADYSLSVFEQVVPKTQPTITSVCQRLLSSGITRRGGFSEQEYVLDEDFAQEYNNVTAPEFSFTNCTLWDALSQVGGYIHAIPRLVPLSTTDDTHYKVTFDKLGGSEQAPTMPPMIYQDSTIDSNEWCGKITSPAQNLCNTTDESGAITELGNDYITVRTEDGQIEINGDNVLIRTSLPIQQLIKLECGFIPDYDSGNTPVGDITAYAYEDAEYSVLSSYWGTAYPYSKAWALRWKQGGTTIDGLTWRQKNVTSIGDAFQNTAIINIINAKTGLSLKSSATNDGEWYRRLAFKVTYVPIATARVEAVKPVLTDGGETSNALVYNQGANVAETSFYGEKMRGAIARLGQDVEQRTYDIKTYSQMPKVGQILDGKYIATIDAEYDITRIRITVTLAKNFNQLSQFVGLNSNYRLYDISEKQSVERHIHYADKILIGKTPAGSNLTILRNVFNVLINTINHSIKVNDKINKAQLVRVLPFSAGNALQDRAVILPVVAFPFGTSICFNFSFYDNYGAGYQSSDDYENEKNKAAQRLVPYTDVYGEVSHIHFAMYNEGWTPNLAAQQDGGYAKLYPQNKDFDWNGGATQIAYIDTSLVGYMNSAGALEINKDSREKIDVTYQVHYIAKSDDIVVGTGLANCCKLVTDTEAIPILGRAVVYVVWLDHTINGLNQYINDDYHFDSIDRDVGYFERIDLGSDSQPYTIVDGMFRWDSRTCPRPGGAKAYAVCKWKGKRRYEMLFGQNVTLDYGDSTDALYFSPISGEAND